MISIIILRIYHYTLRKYAMHSCHIKKPSQCYQTKLKKLKVHGCIVDIDFFNHIYLNPFDGKIYPYFALDTTNKVFFKDVKSLLNSSSFDNKRILRKYSSMSQKGNIPILTHKEYRKQELTAMSEIVLDRSMYEPSRIMRSIQYIFDQNVLRVWKDEVLSISETSPKEMLPNSKKLS
ncbi:hypothetical protein BTH70_05655 [Lactobacillus delbrueckii subsp. bulgaricus]|nr:hypothetical protein [Lactobacillus delbrueckii subsp. bulgaricus]